MAPVPRSLPSNRCSAPFDTTTDTTLWALWLTIWVLTVSCGAFLLSLVLTPNFLGPLSGQTYPFDSNSNRRPNTILPLTWSFKTQSIVRKEDGETGIMNAKAKLRYRIAIGLAVFIALLWAAQGFIVTGALACSESRFLDADAWLPWALFGLQGLIAVLCVLAVWWLNKAWKREVKKNRENKGKGRARGGDEEQGSGGPLTPAAQGLELAELNESRQTVGAEPLELNEQSYTKAAEAPEGESTSSGRRQKPIHLPVSQRSAQMAYGRVTSEVTYEDCWQPIRIAFPGPLHGNGEGGSGDVERLAQLAAAARSQAADAQGFPFPPMGRTPHGTEPVRPSASIRQSALTRRNAVRKTAHTSFPRVDSGVAMGIPQESPVTLQCPLLTPAAPILPLTPPTTPAPAYTAGAEAGAVTEDVEESHVFGVGKTPTPRIVVHPPRRSPSGRVPSNWSTATTAPPSPSMAPLERCPRTES